jgi:hypothetical protein
VQARGKSSTRWQVRVRRATPWGAVQVAARDALRKAERDWLGAGPLLIPDLEASNVHLKRPTAPRGRFHQQLILTQDRVAGVTRFTSAWNTPGPAYPLMWQATVVELASDEETESFVVQHVGFLCASVRKHVLTGRRPSWSCCWMRRRMASGSMVASTRGCGHRDGISPRRGPKEPKFRKLSLKSAGRLARNTRENRS